jgi:glucose-1-phosphate thymidylyltransferase
MKGIILAGGAGSRLYPISKLYSKQLMCIYDKPMIYYPLTSLMLGGIKEILIITTPEDQPSFKELLGDGSQIGLRLEYIAQPNPGGLAQAFLLGEGFIQGECVTLILGDNIFYGYLDFFRRIVRNFTNGAQIFGYQVTDPDRYGVVEFDADGKAITLEEKPEHPKSNFAIPGLYIYDQKVVDIAKALKPSPRGELEITDLNRVYLDMGELAVNRMGRGIAWLDTGTPESLLDASSFIGAIEVRQGMKIGCIEEVALWMKYINHEQLQQLLVSYPKSPYRSYLERLVQEHP